MFLCTAKKYSRKNNYHFTLENSPLFHKNDGNGSHIEDGKAVCVWEIFKCQNLSIFGLGLAGPCHK